MTLFTSNISGPTLNFLILKEGNLLSTIVLSILQFFKKSSKNYRLFFPHCSTLIGVYDGQCVKLNKTNTTVQRTVYK